MADLICDTCAKPYRAPFHLQCHIMKSHLVASDPCPVCDDCGRAFPLPLRKGALFDHIVRRHAPNSPAWQGTRTAVCEADSRKRMPSYRCDGCSWLCKQRMLAEGHITRCFAARARLLVPLAPWRPRPRHYCDSCPYATRHKSNVTTHFLRSHANLDKQSWRALYKTRKQVEKAYSKRLTLRICNDCGFAHSNPNVIFNHYASHHSGVSRAGVPPIKVFCDLCGDASFRKHRVFGHFLSKHLRKSLA